MFDLHGLDYEQCSILNNFRQAKGRVDIRSTLLSFFFSFLELGGLAIIILLEK